jgi:hypothetical protein
VNLTLGWSGPWWDNAGAPRARFAILRSRRAGHACVRPLNLIVSRRPARREIHCSNRSSLGILAREGGWQRPVACLIESSAPVVAAHLRVG